MIGVCCIDGCGKDVWLERMCLVRVVDGASINSLRMEEIAVMSGF